MLAILDLGAAVHDQQHSANRDAMVGTDSTHKNGGLADPSR